MKIDSTLEWKKNQEDWHLQAGDEVLVRLGHPTKGKRELSFEGRKFQLIQKTTWTTAWSIQNQKLMEILHLKFGFWSNKGKIIFQDGGQFECYFKNNPEFQIAIRDLRYGEDLLSYQMSHNIDGKMQPRLMLHQREVFTDKLLFLLALGLALFLHYFEADMDSLTLTLVMTA